MTPAELASLTQQVLWASFFVAMAFGALVQRTGFCTMGAISDVATMGDWTRLRQWALAAGVAMVGFALLSAAGLISPDKTLYASNRWIWLSALVGGAIFGVGMVLASGCASKALVRVGGGNLKALVVVVVLGVSAFATLKGLTAVWRNATVDRVGLDFETTASLPAWAARAFGISPAAAGLALAIADRRRPDRLGLPGPRLPARQQPAGRRGRRRRRGRDVVGHRPLGLSCPSIPRRWRQTILATNSGRAEALSFVSPIAYTLDWLMFYSDRNKLLTVGHRLGVRRDRRLGRGGAGARGAFAGKASAAPTTWRITWPAPC